MATRAESLWTSVVHDAAPRAGAESRVVSVVHTAAPRARAENLWVSVVHTAAPRARAEALWLSVVHDVGAGGGYAVQGEDVVDTKAQGTGSVVFAIDLFDGG